MLAILGTLWKAGRFFKSVFTGGSLDTILQSIDRGMDDGDKKEAVKAEVTKRWIDRQADLLVGRTWWFQLFFVIPLGLWWTAIILDSILPGNWDIAALPAPLDEWAAWIISALFIVDGGKALIGRLIK